MSAPVLPEKEVVDDPPPFLGAWGRVYIGVLIYLALLIFVFFLFTRAYAP